MNEEDKVLAWTIDSPAGVTFLMIFLGLRLYSWNAVYDKLVKTALRYTPVILEHHVPYKTLPNGRLYVFGLLDMPPGNLRIAKAKPPHRHIN